MAAAAAPLQPVETGTENHFSQSILRDSYHGCPRFCTHAALQLHGSSTHGRTIQEVENPALVMQQTHQRDDLFIQ